MPIAVKFGRMVTYLDGLLPIKSKDPLITRSFNITWWTITIISPLPQWVDYFQWLLSTKSYKALATWPCKVKWQIKNQCISITRVAITDKLGMMVTYLDGFLPIKSHDPLITWSCNITWHTKTIISLLSQHLWLPNAVDGDIPWVAPNHKVIQRSDRMVLQSHMANKNHYIFTTKVPMAPKCSRMIS